MRLTILAIVIVWLIPTVGVLVTSFRPRGARRHPRGGGRRFAHPFDAAQWTIQNYKDCARRRRVRQRVPEQPGSSDPFHGHPDHDRRLRRVRVLRGWISGDATSCSWLVVGLLVVPLQMALIPILRLYVGGATLFRVKIFPDLDLAGTFLGVWLAHAGFGLPLAVVPVYATTSGRCRPRSSSRPRSTAPITSRSSGGWIVPLSVPALAAFTIFQFLWVWNDLLVALVFLGGTRQNRVLTIALTELVEDSGGRTGTC